MSDPSKTYPSFEAIFAHWEALLAGAEANRESLSALEPFRAQLEAALKDTREVYTRKLDHEQEALEMTQDLHTQVKSGRDVAAQLESGVRMIYGRRSPKLLEFGMKPLLPRVGKKTVDPEEETEGCPPEASATAK
jgi:hypothetical protein